MNTTRMHEIIDWKKNKGLVPAIIQDFQSQRVLMLGYMNLKALQKTTEEKKVTFYSRSRKVLWTKGEISGNFLLLKKISYDCDGDTLLVQVEPVGPVCHTGARTCFGVEKHFVSIGDLEQIIKQRSETSSPSSYTSRLLGDGVLRIAQKVGEEAVEVCLAAASQQKDSLREETADLLYHLLVLMRAFCIPLSDIEKVLTARNSASHG